MSELIPISALIGDRTYRIKVEPQHEAQVRQTLQSINDKILEFKQQFAGKDMQDYIAMTLLWFATQPKALSNANPVNPAVPPEENSNTQELHQGLALLEELLDKALKS
jgi:cell division protein ZapA